MANSVISNLITTNITQNGGIDRITATEVRSVLNAINSFIQDDISYGTAIPFDRMVSKMAPHTVSGPITFTKNTTGAIPGGGTILELTANGSNIPNFSDFNETMASSGWVNTAGVVNVCIFLYTGTQYLLTITQEKLLTQLATPGSFAAAAVSSSQINLSWTDVSNETGYKIYFNGINDFNSAGLLTTTAANATAYSHTGLSASSIYYYWIIAAGDGVTYSDSNSASANATTSGAGTTLNAPTGVTLGAATSTTQPLTWTDTNTSPNENGYKVYRNTANNFSTATLATTTAANATSYTVTGLTASTLYYYWVVAQGNGTTTSDSSPSTVASGSTTSASGYQTESDTYFSAVATAGGSLTTGQKDAYDAWVVAEKSGGRYSKYTTIYPFMGGTGASHAINAANPGSRNLIFNGAWTHDAQGSKPTTADSSYAQSGVNNSDMTQDNNFFSLYTNQTGNDGYMLGAYSNNAAFRLAHISGTMYTSAGNNAANTTSVASAVGYHIVSRITSTQYYYVNGAGTNTITQNSDAYALPVVELYLSDISNITAGGSTNRLCFVTMGITTGLTSSEATAAVTNQNTLQTALGR